MKNESKIALILLVVLWIVPMVLNCGGEGGVDGGVVDTKPLVLSGRITTPAGTPVVGVTVNLSGTGRAAGCSGYGYHSEDTVTDSNGDYSFSGDVISGSGTVRPNNPEFTFVPQSIQVNSSSSGTGLDFVAHLIYTLYPESVTNTSAYLVGRANPYGQQTSVYFQWSANASFSSFYTTTSEDLGSDYQGHMVRHRISTLTPGQTYYYRIVSQTATGSVFLGNIVSFKTGTAPIVSTNQAREIKVHSAVLRGTFNPDGLFTSASFEWSINPDLSDPVSTPILATGGSTTSISFEYYLDNLTENSTYYYRAIASNYDTAVQGATIFFTTLPLALPAGTTEAAIYLKASSARVSGTVNANGSAATAWFEWGQDPNLATYNTDGVRSVGDDIDLVNVYHDLRSLEETTTYYFRVAASNEAGTWKGPILSFTTLINPLVITQPPTLVDDSGGTFNGAVDNFGYDSTVWFLWGTDPALNYGVRTSNSPILEGTGTQTFSDSLSGMAPSTRYYFRAQAMTSTGSGHGGVLPFTTLSATGASFWSKTYSGSDVDKATGIRRARDGGYVVNGWTWSFDNIWAMKLTEHGDIQWQKSFGGFLLDHVTNTIRETSDGGYVLAGQMDENGAGQTDYWILKLDPSGEILWQRTYGESGFDIAQAIQQTSDGGYIAAGYTNSFGAGDWDIWVLKLDYNGNVQWQKALGTPVSDYAFSIEEADSGFVVGAQGRSGIGVLLIKLGIDGTVMWTRSYGDFEIRSMAKTGDGGYVLGGFSTGGDIIILKTDGNGTIQWQRSLNGTETVTHITSVAPAGTEGCLIGGYTNSFNSEGPYDAFVLKLDGNGDVQWQKAYGGKGDDRINGVQENNDGSIAVAGFTSSFGVGGLAAWVLKLTDEGSCPPLDRDISFTVQGISNAAVDAILTVTDTNLVYQDTTTVATDTFFIPMQQAP